MQVYDYSALDSSTPVSAASTTSSLNIHDMNARPIQILIAVMVIGSFLGFFVIFFGAMTSLSAATIITSLAIGLANYFLIGVIFAAVVVYLLFHSKKQKQRFARIAGFAKANALVFKQNIGPEGMRGLIFDNGHTQTIREVLSFPEGIELGTYSYITGSGKNSRSHTYGFVRVALKRHLPNMVLDAKANNFLGMTNLPDVFQSSQRLSLEGDFNTYFDLYAPNEYEKDALYVFTPDVMRVLIDDGKKFDIEIVDDELYLYQPTGIDIASEAMIKSTLQAVEAIAKELRDQTHRYTDERRVVENHAGPQPFVAEEGRRLKKGVNHTLVAILAGAIMVYVSTGLLPQDVRFPVSFVLGLVFWVSIIILGIISLRRRN